MKSSSLVQTAIFCFLLGLGSLTLMAVAAESSTFPVMGPFQEELRSPFLQMNRLEEPQRAFGRDPKVFRRVTSWPYGQALAVAVDSVRNLIFVSSGGAVMVLDADTPATNPRLLADNIYTVGYVEDIAYDYSTERLFLACGEGGLEIWDVHDPSRPVQLSVLEVLYYGFETPVANVDVWRDFAIVECSWGYVHTIDVSDPRNPVQAGFSGLMGNPAYDIHMGYDGFLHTVGAQYYVKYYIDAYGDLNSVSEVYFTYGAHRVFGTEDATFIYASGYLYILPNYGSIDIGGGVDDIFVQGDYLYFTSAFDLRILDISDLYNPYEIGSITLPGAPSKLEVVGNYAYLGGGYAGLQIVDVSDPSVPRVIGFHDTFGATVDMCPRGDYAYLAEVDDGMLVLDLTGAFPSSALPSTASPRPVLVGQYDTPGLTYDIAVAGDYAYLADWEGGFRIVDISDPTDPEEVGVADMKYAYVVCVSGAYAYVIDNILNLPDTLRVFDISDPSKPTEVAVRYTQSEVKEMVVSGDYLYVAAEDLGMRVVDISDPHNPVQVGYYIAPDVRDVKVSGDYAYLASADWDGGFLTLDISDPTRPILVSAYEYGWYFPFDIAVQGDYAYMADPSSELIVALYIGDRANPVKLDTYVSPGSMSELFALDSLLYISDGSAGLLILDNELYGTPGVLNWKSQESGTNNHLRCVYFADATTGWTVGDYGTILKTEDSGEHWFSQTSGTGEDLFAVYTEDGTIGWAGGREGVILKTTDGGGQWSPQASGTSEQIRAMQFVNDMVGWAVGGGGVILKTTDGGDHWQPQVSGTSGVLESVSFVDSLHGWAAGFDEGLVLKTTDGGSRWETVYVPTSAILEGVCFVTEETGWVVGEDATIMKTTDGGTVWVEQYSDPETPYCWLSSISCIDEQMGWTVGNIALEGQSFKTTDGGGEWDVMYGGDETYLQSVHFVDEHNGWAVGQYGTIIRSIPE